MTVAGYALLTFALYLLLTFVYHWSMAWLAHRWGIAVELVRVGFGKRLCGWQGRHWAYEVGVLLWGGFTKFKGEEQPAEADQEPPVAAGSFQTAAAGRRLGVALTGPAVLIAIGLVCLALPVEAGDTRLMATTPDKGRVKPSALGGLLIEDGRPSWSDQWHLVQDTTGEFLYRLVTFQSLEGWGVWFGGCVTAGAVAEQSTWSWVSLMGALALFLGVMNLVPVPGLNGFHAFAHSYAWLRGRELPEAVWAGGALIGMLFLMTVLLRCLALDAAWVWHLVVG